MKKEESINAFNSIISEIKKDFTTAMNVFTEGMLKQIDYKLVSFGNAFVAKQKFDEEPKPEDKQPKTITPPNNPGEETKAIQ